MATTLTGNEIFQIQGVDNIGRPSGTTETVSTLQLATYALSGAVANFNFGYSQVLAAGTTQNTATLITTNEVLAITTATNQGILFPPVTLGAQQLIINGGTFPLNVYPNGTNNFINLAASAAFVIPPGYSGLFLGITTGEWSTAIGNVPPGFQYYSNTAIGSSAISAGTLVGNIGFQDITLAMTGALTGAATATFPSVAAVLSDIYNPFIGQAWRFRFINESTNTQAWTIATPAGWSTGGTLTVNQNTWRDFYITITAAASLGMQSIGTGTYS